MTDIELKNKLLAAYSRSFGNNERSLIACAEENNLENYHDFKEEFDAIQMELYNFLEKYADENKIQLNGLQLETMVKAYCEAKYAWIDADAMKSLIDLSGSKRSFLFRPGLQLS